MLSVSLVSRVTANYTIICLGVNRHLASGHEISRLQHGLQLIMARYTRIINCCNLYIVQFVCLKQLSRHNGDDEVDAFVAGSVCPWKHERLKTSHFNYHGLRSMGIEHSDRQTASRSFQLSR